MRRNRKEPRPSAFSVEASSRITSASGWSTCPITHSAPSVIRATATVISAAAGPAATRAPERRAAVMAIGLRISDALRALQRNDALLTRPFLQPLATQLFGHDTRELSHSTELSHCGGSLRLP